MNLQLNKNITSNYKSNSQIARVLTEDWVKNNSYCPICGKPYLCEFENNKPVADFFCDSCHEQYELKSKNDTHVGTHIVDGAYSTMIERINSSTNPNFFFLTYNRTQMEVNNFLIIPKHYFISDIIIKRRALPSNARRAGWIGSIIDISKIPVNGKIFIIKDSKVVNKDKVLEKWKRTSFIKNKRTDSKGWILDIMNCIDTIEDEHFSLKDMYKFENVLKLKYPNNHYIKDKIRQQLQVLRDKGLIDFLSRGNYKKLYST